MEDNAMRSNFERIVQSSWGSGPCMHGPQAHLSDDVLLDYTLGFMEAPEKLETESSLRSCLDCRLRLDEIREELRTPMPTEIEDRLRPKVFRHRRSEPELANAASLALPSRRQKCRLAKQIQRAVLGAAKITYVTNFFGGRRREPGEVGHSNLKFAEFEAITERVLDAVDSEESLHCIIVMQDFQSWPHIIIARQLLRHEEKYLEKKLLDTLDHVSREISDVLRVCQSLTERLEFHPNVKFELRATMGLVACPVICSEVGAASGSYLANLSDFVGPTSWHNPGTEEYDLLCDNCREFAENSIQILGDKPHSRAKSFLMLGTNEKELRKHFLNLVDNDPLLFPKEFKDRRELLGPEI